MDNICPQCGTEIPEGSNGCQACGWGAIAKLQLSGKNGSISTAIGLEIGKVLGTKLCGDEARFMDDIQFKIRTADDKWFIKPYPRIKNPIHINGALIAGETAINDGDQISLKGKAAFIDVKMI